MEFPMVHNELNGSIPIQLLPPVAAAAGSNILEGPPQSMSIDRSTVGLEDGSVASNGGEPNRLEVEVVSFTLKDSFQWLSRSRELPSYLSTSDNSYIYFCCRFLPNRRRRFELLLVDVGCRDFYMFVDKEESTRRSELC